MPGRTGIEQGTKKNYFPHPPYLKFKKKTRGAISKREVLLIEQEGKCKYCKALLVGGRYDANHEPPLARVKANKGKNYTPKSPNQLLCKPCHDKKTAKEKKNTKRNVEIYHAYHDGKEFVMG